MESFSSSLEQSPQLKGIVAMVEQTCNKLMQAMSWSFDTLAQYGTQTIQWVSRGVQSLFVDVIVRLLHQLSILIKELYQDWSTYAQETIEYYRQTLQGLSQKHNFFNRHFAWRIDEIFQY